VASKIGKGSRVKVTSGKNGVGSVGTVFWTGPDKYNEDNQRLGVRADDGETLWVSEAVVEEVTGSAAAQPDAGPPPDKGARVKWTNRGDTGEGTIFWVGQNKSGPGHRVGVRLDDQEDPLWLDGRQITVIDSPPKATSALPRSSGGGRPKQEDDDVDMYADGAVPAGMPVWDEGAPVDESFAPSDEETPPHFDEGPQW
jgi:hypothetical protein